MIGGRISFKIRILLRWFSARIVPDSDNRVWIEFYQLYADAVGCPRLSTRFSLILQIPPVLVLGLFQAVGACLACVQGRAVCWRINALQKPVFPRVGWDFVNARPSPSPLGGIILICVLHSLPETGTKLQFPPTVVTGWVTHSSWLPSLPCVTSHPPTGVSWDYFPKKVQLNFCLKTASGETQT